MNIMLSQVVPVSIEGQVKASKLGSSSTCGVVYVFIDCAGLFGRLVS